MIIAIIMYAADAADTALPITYDIFFYYSVLSITNKIIHENRNLYKGVKK
jgi:hypothetical protein